MNRHVFYPPGIRRHRRRASDAQMVFIRPLLARRVLANFSFNDSPSRRLKLAAQAGLDMLGEYSTRKKLGGVLSDADIAAAIREAGDAPWGHGNRRTQQRRVRLLRQSHLLQQDAADPGLWVLAGYEHKNYDLPRLAARRGAHNGRRRQLRAERALALKAQTSSSDVCPPPKSFEAGDLAAAVSPNRHQSGLPAVRVGSESKSNKGTEKKIPPKSQGAQSPGPYAPADGIFLRKTAGVPPPGERGKNVLERSSYEAHLNSCIRDARKMGDLVRLKSLWRQRGRTRVQHVFNTCSFPPDAATRPPPDPGPGGETVAEYNDRQLAIVLAREGLS